MVKKVPSQRTNILGAITIGIEAKTAKETNITTDTVMTTCANMMTLILSYALVKGRIPGRVRIRAVEASLRRPLQLRLVTLIKVAV